MRIIIVAILFCVTFCAKAVDPESYIRNKKQTGDFPLTSTGNVSPLIYSANDFPGVIRAIQNLQQDITRVSGRTPTVSTAGPTGKTIILIGTIGKNPLIDQLIKKKKIDGTRLIGKREAFIVQVIDKPFKGVDQALVIAGSEKRGTIYGIYDLSQQIGVSPWYWWADVPVKKQSEIFVTPGVHTKGSPAVEYRGIFINDEQPALGGWVRDNTGGFNHQFYEKVFELILRMKGNFLWPAMWGQSFFSDDSLNHKLADEYGIVIGTSHHEPLMRAHVEWQRQGGGPWNYNSNEQKLKTFWSDGITRMKKYESIITLAMRGDGDEPMSEESNVKLLQRIVSDQRKIIADVTGKDITKVPQVWALYKEVQDYYDKGMRVPDDVTLLLCDDNWGNIRKLPSVRDQKHPGGYGIYYHYDYVGDPRNYKWLNTNPIAKVWEQMHLAYEFKATKIWIVNVGDIKPMEFPIEFFLDYAWNPNQWRHDKLVHYTELWAEREFGKTHSKEIARIMALYTKYNGRRKPEMLDPDSFSPQLYSLVSYREAENVVADYRQLAKEAELVYNDLATEYKDAFYQLILYPVKGCANINEMYYHVRLNNLYSEQGRTSTNEHADTASQLFVQDSLLAEYYNKTMSKGKWNHFMDQKRIGYIGWHDDFKKNTLPELKSMPLNDAGEPGLAFEGSSSPFVSNSDKNILPGFDSFGKQERYFELFNKGQLPFSFKIQCSQPFIKFSEASGEVSGEKRIFISIDWGKKAPPGKNSFPINIEIPDHDLMTLMVAIDNATPDNAKLVKGFVGNSGYISIEAEHFQRAENKNGFTWTILPDHGRTLSAITTFPAAGQTVSNITDSPYVEYDVHFAESGKVNVNCYLSPTIDFTGGNGLKYALSIDDANPVVVNMHQKNTHKDWQESVKDNIRVVSTTLEITTPGLHHLRFYRIDPGVVLQKVVIDTGGLKPSYLGPPESTFVK